MNCRRVQSLLSNHLEGRLPEAASEAVTTHVADCPVCRRRHEQLLALGDDLRAFTAPPSSTELPRRAVELWLAEQRDRRQTADQPHVRSPFSVGTTRLSFPLIAAGAAGVLIACLGRELIGAAHRSSRTPMAAMVQRSDSNPHSRRRGESQKGTVRHSGVGSQPVPVHPPQAALQSTTTLQDRPAPQSGDEPPHSREAPLPFQPFSVSHFALSPPSRFRDNNPGTTAADDLAVLNGTERRAAPWWSPLKSQDWDRIEEHVRRNVRVQDDFVQVPLPRLASTSVRQIVMALESGRQSDPLSPPTPLPRLPSAPDHLIVRELERYKREAAVVDPRLFHEVTCAFKATALSDLCERLRADTGIQLAVGPSVADEKVTLLCERLPLREVMRQLSRPFGYTWLRSKPVLGVRSSVLGKEPADPNTQHPTPNTQYRYELVQDLRSQLLEEELRNRDRNEALIALDREMSRYHPYLGLSPVEALARAKTAPPEEKPLLEHMATDGWGLAQIWFRLSPQQLNALRAGAELKFSQEPEQDQQPLPPDLAKGILESERGRRIFVSDGKYRLGDDKGDGLLATAVPEARAMLTISMPQSELGQFTLTGGPGVFISANSQTPGTFSVSGSAGSLAIGRSPSVLNPDNATANSRLARDPALRARVTITPVPGSRRTAVARDEHHPGAGPEKVTTAEVLEAIHQATGLPIVADFYTHLYRMGAVTIKDRPAFEALNQLADRMHMRWNKEGAWLQFRSTGFFNDRLKEVPNRLLGRWSTARRQRGMLTLDELIEIAGLSDAQLDAADMAEGAQEIWGLAEWELLSSHPYLRPHLRYLAGFTPAQRQEATSPAGLLFRKLTLAQQQQFLSYALLPGKDWSDADNDLAGATLRVEYTQPGWFEWAAPEWNALLPSAVRERTREAALQAALRIDPQATEAQIRATKLDLVAVYDHAPRASYVRIVRTQNDGWINRRPER